MNEKVSYLLPEDYPAPCGILREHFPDFAAVSRFRGGWGYGADDAVSIIMPEAAPEPGKDAAEEFSFEERLKGISLQNAFIVMRTREELFFSRPEGERFVNQACRKRGQAFCLVKGVPHDLIRIDVTAYPETAWAGIEADWEAHDGFRDDPEEREKILKRLEPRKITYQTGCFFNISNFR